MKFTTISILMATLATVSAVALPPATSAALDKRNLWDWFDGDEQDKPLPDRFSLSISTPGNEFADYKFVIDWGNLGLIPWLNNIRLSPRDAKVYNGAVATSFYGQTSRFYFAPEGESIHLYMDIFAQASSQVWFRSLDNVHYHSGYTFDGFSVWHNRLVRRYEMNDSYKVAPQNQWIVCEAYDNGEVSLIWDAHNDSDAPGFISQVPPGPGCTKVDLIVTPI